MNGMKEFVRQHKILLGVVLIGFVFALLAISGRWQVENANKTYDVVLDFEELELMAGQSGESLEWWLDQFKEMGIDKVGLPEQSLRTMTNNPEIPVSATMMYSVLKSANWQNEYPADFVDKAKEAEVDVYDVLVEAGSRESFRFITEALTSRWDESRYVISETEDGGFILIDGSAGDALYSAVEKNYDSTKTDFAESSEIVSSQIMYLSLGLLPEQVARLEARGMEVIPRTFSYNGWNDSRYAEAVLDGYKSLNKVPSYIIAAGKAVIGSDNDIEIVTKYILDNDITIAMIEDTTQLQNIMQSGLELAVLSTDYNAVRVFTVWDYIQNRYQYYGYEGAKEIENTLFRAITERNVRVVYYKPIKEFKDHHVYITDVQEYRDLFSNLDQRLEEHGISRGKASVMEPYRLRLRTKVGLTFGTVAAAILMLLTILPIKKKYAYGLLALGCLGATGAFVAAPSLAGLLSSFAAAVVFPCLAISFIVKLSKDHFDNLNKDERLFSIIVKAVFALVVSVAISFIGGLMTAAPLSEIGFMLEIDIFRGVKLAQILPLGFFILAYLAYFGFGARKEQAGQLEVADLKDMFTTNIQIWMVILGAAVAGVGVYYIIRTGHDTAVLPSNIEMIFRNALEDNLIARPRNKEFLFGFPAAMLLIYTATRRLRLWSVLFGLSSVIGMTCVVNTFMHFRTPLYLGFARTGFSMIFGIVIGIVGIVIFDLLYKLYKKLERQFS